MAWGTNTEHSPSPRPEQNLSTSAVRSTIARREVSIRNSSVSTGLFLVVPGRRPAVAATVGRVPTLPTVLVARQSDGNFAVRVRNGKSETSHVVAVPSELETELGLEATSAEALVRASFAFLLDREPSSSILPKFSLDVISRYFPEYRREIHKYL